MSPLENVECRQCFILPMCIGGCKQRLLENKKFDRCPHGFSESDKQRFAEQYILEKFK
jgi:radical SAM protein with 4Fe4S-binding SPASM domain